jgi:hypothetical protein
MKSCLAQTRAGIAAGAILAFLSLSGCISSTAPILADAQDLLGQRGQIHLFPIVRGATADGGTATYRWNGSRYVVRGRSARFSDFTLHPYEGRDLIMQLMPRGRPTTYALARKLADGAYLLVPLDVELVDESARARHCTKTVEAECRITTPEQVFVFAKAVADASIVESAPAGSALAVILPARR